MSQSVFPGRLHLYNVETGDVHTIATNQADSEILLVDGTTVYYRVSDCLYQADIGTKEVSGTRLLVQAEDVRDGHWAFQQR